MKIAQLQTHVFREKDGNLEQMASIMNELDGKDVDLVTAGEMFCCPYEVELFSIYAEAEGGDMFNKLSELAKKHNVYLQAGTVPEIDHSGNIYNTAYVFDRSGKMIAKHRKAHLFDINISGGQSFKESDTLTAGDQITVFDTELCRMSMCICFDCRFPEMSRIASQEGAEILLVPAAFNMTTGPAHWEIMFRSRAIDNQIFVAGTSVARDMSSAYHAWGHSMIVDPWGTILSEMDEKEGINIIDVDLANINRVRHQLPLMSARRTDMYELKRI